MQIQTKAHTCYLALVTIVLAASASGAQPKTVVFTVSRHPSLSAPVDLKSLFARGATLLREDDDGSGMGADDDVSLEVAFTLPTAVQSVFPDQSSSNFPARERYNYRLPKYNEIRNDLDALQLREATFADLKQVAYGNGFTGWANSTNKTIILTQSTTAATTVHEWGHLCGLPHRDNSTNNIMYAYTEDDRKEINVHEMQALQAY